MYLVSIIFVKSFTYVYVCTEDANLYLICVELL